MLQRVPIDEPIVTAITDVLVFVVTTFRPEVVLLIYDLPDVGSIPGLENIQREIRVNAAD